MLLFQTLHSNNCRLKFPTHTIILQRLIDSSGALINNPDIIISPIRISTGYFAHLLFRCIPFGILFRLYKLVYHARFCHRRQWHCYNGTGEISAQLAGNALRCHPVCVRCCVVCVRCGCNATEAQVSPWYLVIGSWHNTCSDDFFHACRLQQHLLLPFHD